MAKRRAAVLAWVYQISVFNYRFIAQPPPRPSRHRCLGLRDALEITVVDAPAERLGVHEIAAARATLLGPARQQRRLSQQLRTPARQQAAKSPTQKASADRGKPQQETNHCNIASSTVQVCYAPGGGLTGPFATLRGAAHPTGESASAPRWIRARQCQQGHCAWVRPAGTF